MLITEYSVGFKLVNLTRSTNLKKSPALSRAPSSSASWPRTINPKFLLMSLYLLESSKLLGFRIDRWERSNDHPAMSPVCRSLRVAQPCPLGQEHKGDIEAVKSADALGPLWTQARD